MKYISALAVAAGVAAGSAALADDEVKYGKHICITDRAVGIQTPESSTNRYAGVIVPSPGHQKFFVTIRKIEKVDSSTRWLKDGITEHYPEPCFNKKNIDHIERQWENEDIEYGGEWTEVDLYNFPRMCLAKSVAELKTDQSRPTSYFSLGKNVFNDSI